MEEVWPLYLFLNKEVWPVYLLVKVKIIDFSVSVRQCKGGVTCVSVNQIERGVASSVCEIPESMMTQAGKVKEAWLL